MGAGPGGNRTERLAVGAPRRIAGGNQAGAATLFRVLGWNEDNVPSGSAYFVVLAAARGRGPEAPGRPGEPDLTPGGADVERWRPDPTAPRGFIGQLFGFDGRARRRSVPMGRSEETRGSWRRSRTWRRSALPDSAAASAGGPRRRRGSRGIVASRAASLHIRTTIV